MTSLRHRIITKYEIGPYVKRLRRGFVARPDYGFCIYNAALLASRLGLPRISVLELGVAGGNGLLAMEYHARQAEKATGTRVDVYGFDTGEGLPPPADYRDLPFTWKSGFHRMQVPSLQARLTKAKLILGRIRDTAARFFEEHAPAPIGMVSVDVDYYSSTVDAFPLFEGPYETLLPRVFCYFDDVLGSETSLVSEFTGERLAIREFNRTHEDRKLDLHYHLALGRRPLPWHHRVRILHSFHHPQYCTYVAQDDKQLPLR